MPRARLVQQVLILRAVVLTLASLGPALAFEPLADVRDFAVRLHSPPRLTPLRNPPTEPPCALPSEPIVPPSKAPASNDLNICPGGCLIGAPFSSRWLLNRKLVTWPNAWWRATIACCAVGAGGWCCSCGADE